MLGPRVVLLRSPSDSENPDPYIVALDEAGFHAVCVPVLRFEPVDRDELRATMRRPDIYAGLLLTSPRAADALDGLDLTGWRDKPAFVVGPATGDRAAALGLRPVGDESGDAAALADLLIAARAFDRPLLFLCGDRRRDTLPDRLRAAGIDFDERVVYRTLADAGALLEAGPPEWVVFFSPSGVEAALAADALPWNRLSLAAIGPTTAAALRDAGVTPAAVALSPTPESLAIALADAPPRA